MRAAIPVNPETLRWARESINMPLEEVALRMKKNAETIEDWESGTRSPTYVQLEKLAYQVYKRPIAVFFFPQPPEEADPQNSFRTLPESVVSQLSPRFLHLFRRAQAMQANLDELNDGLNPAARKIFRDLRFEARGELGAMVTQVRRYLGVDLQTQMGWKNVDTALKEWRKTVEANGIYVFKEAFRQKDVSGFCLYDEEFPVIYINNSMMVSRQIFTLLHELAHLLFKTGGIDEDRRVFLRRLHGDNRRIEILCNQFVGEFLVPTRDFAKAVSGKRVDDEVVKTLANKFKVSQEVILRKCLDRGLINQGYYESKRQEGIERARQQRAGAAGGNYYYSQAAYLGDTYLGLVFSKYYQKGFSAQQLAEYLNVKVDHVREVETLFLGRG